MFSSGHFIWLGAIAVLIALSLILIKKLNVSQSIVQKTVLVLLVCLKLFHLSLS